MVCGACCVCSCVLVGCGFGCEFVGHVLLSIAVCDEELVVLLAGLVRLHVYFSILIVLVSANNYFLLVFIMICG